MTGMTVRPAEAARKTPAPPSPADRELERLINDPRATAQAARACEARQHTGRRRLVDPTTCERDYAAAELEFMMAMQEYKKRSGRMFPTWSEVLEVLTGLGYEKVAGPATEPRHAGRRGGWIMMRADTVTSEPESHGPPMDATAPSRLMQTPSTLGVQATPTGRVSPAPVSAGAGIARIEPRRIARCGTSGARASHRPADRSREDRRGDRRPPERCPMITA